MLRILVALTLASLAFVLAAVAQKRGVLRGGYLTPLADNGGPGLADQALGCALCLGFTAILLASAHSLGFARDEGIYFDAAKSYAGWFETLLSPDRAVRATAFEQAVVDAHWGANAEHPSLMKSGFALCWIYLWKSWPTGLVELFHGSAWTRPLSWAVVKVARSTPQLFVEESAAFRFPSMLAGGLILWVTYLFGAEVRGRTAGLCAALMQAGLPRPFFDAHLAGFDAGAALAWLAVAYAYWKGLRSTGWAIASGFIWGLALLTKHNSWFLPIVFVLHYAWTAIDVLRRAPGAPPTIQGRLRALPIPWPFLFMGMIGPAVFIYGWPRLWFDTWSRIDWYFSFHAHHEHYSVEYLHRTYFRAPYPLHMVYVLTLATVPTTILVAGLIGVASRWRALLRPLVPELARVRLRAFARHAIDDDRRTSFFWFVNLNLPLAIIAHPTVPHFGGTKHWHAAYPFLCMFAGAGVVTVATALLRNIRAGGPHAIAPIPEVASQGGGRRTAPALLWHVVLYVGLVLLCALPGWLETRRSHPHGLSHYVPLVGGPAGGADLGLNRGFWGYETGAITDWLNHHFPNGARVYPNDTISSAWEQLHADGRLHANIEAESFSVSNCDVAVIEHEQHMDEVEAQIWMAFGTVVPAHVVQLDGVPVLTVYVNPRSSRYVP